MRILLVEDDAMVSKLYQSKFDLERFETIIASNGQEALDKLPSNPDLILLDLMMPVMDGFEFLEKVKKDPKYAKIPVIVLSILGQEADIKKAQKLGAIDYFVKEEVTPGQVVERIRQHFPQKP